MSDYMFKVNTSKQKTTARQRQVVGQLNTMTI